MKVNKKIKEKKLNPFELHINNKKFTILGRKSKNEVGQPGIARSKSIQKVHSNLFINMDFNSYYT
jgi:nucleolar protein 14